MPAQLYITAGLYAKVCRYHSWEVDFRFLRRRQQVKYGVGRAPIAISNVMAFSNAALLAILPAVHFRHFARSNVWSIQQCVTGIEEQLLTIGVSCQQRAVAGCDRPSASVRQFIELAVNIRSRSRRSDTRNVQPDRSGSQNFRVCALDHRINQIELDDLMDSLVFPASIGPPETKITGISGAGKPSASPG